MIISVGQIIAEVIRNPNWVSKTLVLILVGLYVIFAVRVWVQVRRLEHWLPLLRGHSFGIWALIHLLLAMLGLGLAVIIL